MNPAFHQPVVCVALGLILITTSLVLLTVFSINDNFAEENGKTRDISVTLTCILGACLTLIGCCVCCSRRERIKQLWEDSIRKQGLHRLQRNHGHGEGVPQSRPIVSGYDPRTVEC